MRRCIVLIVCVTAVFAAAAMQWRNVKIGEPMTTAYALHRAADGRMWVGTNHGLYTYDGYRAKRVCAGSPLFDSQVYGISQAGDTCWLGTNNGLLAYEPAQGRGHAVEGDLPIEIRSTLLTADTLRIGSLYGLYYYVPRTGRSGRMAVELPHRAVYALVETEPGGDIYIGTYGGMCRYSPRSGRCDTVALPSRSGGVFVNALAWDATTGTLWAGLENGLVRYSPATGRAESVVQFRDVSVKSLAVYPGGLVVGTDGGLYTLGSHGMRLHRHDSRVESSIGDDAIWALNIDSEGNVWAATEMGVSVGNSNAAVNVVKISDISHRGDGQAVYHFLRDSRGALWMGGSNGLIRTSPDGADVRWYMPDDASSPFSHSRVRDIYESPGGDIWVACDGGLNRYDAASGQFVNYRVHDRSGNFKANWAYGVSEDAAGDLWVGSYLGGVNVASRAAIEAAPRGGDITADMSFNSSTGLHNDFLGAMERTPDGAVWVKLFRDSAITRIDTSRGVVSRFSLASAGVLPVEVVVGDGGTVWIGHDRGIVHIDATGRVLRSVSFPAQEGEERMLAMERVGDELWVSTVHALWALDMHTMALNLLPVPEGAYTAIYNDCTRGRVLLGTVDRYVEVVPGLLRTPCGDLQLHIVGVEVDGAERAASEAVSLPADHRSLVVELSCLDFTPGSYRKYAYRLDGGDDTWTMLPVGDNRVELRTLPVGRHSLEVMVAGYDDTRRTITIDVLPPWYLSAWALVAYAAFAAVVAALCVGYVRRRRTRMRLEEERRRTLAEVEGRIRLLGDISHDLKTPLSMVMGAAGKLRETCADTESRADIDTIYRNSVKLNELIHRSLDLDAPDSPTAPESMLIYSRIDAVAFVADIVASWAARCTDRSFVFNHEADSLPLDADVVKLESIVNNLLSNAAKYTSAGCEICVELAHAGGNVVLRVADNGPGIPAADLPLIFRRHYRAPATADTHEGTGIGLWLVRHYAELHGGSVEAESRTGESSRTVFTVVLPAEKEQRAEPAVADSGDKHLRALIVDDNRELARFVASLLAGDFATRTAPDGATALEEAVRFRPDVVVADYQMPGMSGVELCRRMRAIEALRGVPVVLLTGVGGRDVEAESVDAGVDLFIAKPFDGALLRRRVRNLVERSALAGREARLAGLADAHPIEAESQPERMLGRINDIIEANISNPDLNVTFLSEQSGIHAKQLYRVVKEHLGVTPVEYIRRMRLRKAAHLIGSGGFSVSEVMYMVGFSSASYFAKCFQAEFGCKPRDYRGEDNL